jgi:hypothetical protein
VGGAAGDGARAVVHERLRGVADRAGRVDDDRRSMTASLGPRTSPMRCTTSADVGVCSRRLSMMARGPLRGASSKRRARSTPPASGDTMTTSPVLVGGRACASSPSSITGIPCRLLERDR